MAADPNQSQAPGRYAEIESANDGEAVVENSQLSRISKALHIGNGGDGITIAFTWPSGRAGHIYNPPNGSVYPVHTQLVTSLGGATNVEAWF